MLIRTLLLLLGGAGALRVPVAPLRPMAIGRARPPTASALSTVGAGLLAGSGTAWWTAPQWGVEKLGQPSRDEAAVAMMRVTAAWQICLAAVLFVGKKGPALASGYGLIAAGLTNLVIVPTWETLGRPKGSMVGGSVLFFGLGHGILMGKISPLVAAGIYSVLGALIYLTPVATAKLYEVKKPFSDAAHALLALGGGMMLTAGLFLGGLAKGWLTGSGQSVAAILVLLELKVLASLKK